MIKTATKFLGCKICQIQEMHYCWIEQTLRDWGDLCAVRIMQCCEIDLKHWGGGGGLIYFFFFTLMGVFGNIREILGV